MRILLDTHALLWWWGEPHLLSKQANSLMAQPENQILVSSASAWEVATKVRLGKLPNAKDAVPNWLEWVSEDGFTTLPINSAHALRAGSLLREHRDPFDRMLAAQAVIENVTLLTKDPALRRLGADTLW